MLELTDKKILVTGGAGFLGKFVVRKLQEKGYRYITVPRSKDYNLTDNTAVKRLYHDSQPDIVIHLAAVVGGIQANIENPGRFFYENLMMGAQMIEQGRLFGIEKFVSVGSICAYPKFAPIPFKEENFWEGYPEETNAPYGFAKKMLLVQSQAYREQYGLNAIYLIPANLYGPGDNFDPAYSHVIPAMIRKCVDAIKGKQDEILVWGTGRPTREFFYIEDAAEGIFLATELYDKPAPVNIGTGDEVSIKSLQEMVVELTNYQGRVVWDASKPDGQPKRVFDCSKAEKEFGFKAKTPLIEGLRKTIDWYITARTQGFIK